MGDDFDQCLVESKKMSKQFKGSVWMSAVKFSQKLLTCFPASIVKGALDDFTPSLGFSYSNMLGPKNGFDMNGVKCKRIFGIGPAVGKLINSMMIVSSVMENKTTIGIGTCKNHIEDVEDWVSIYKDNMDQFLNGGKKTN
jgi:hypothetical protein